MNKPLTCIPVPKIENNSYDWEKRHAKILDLVGSSSVCEKAGIAGTPVQSSQNPA